MRDACWLVALLALTFAATGCGSAATEIVVRDPFAVSLSRVDGCDRTQLLPAEPAPTPPTNKVDRAMWSSRSFGAHHSVSFEQSAASGTPRWVARRFDAGGLNVAARPAYGGDDVLSNEGIIHLYGSDLPFTRITIDRVAGELVVTIYHHRASRSRGPSRAQLDLELRTPLANVVQMRTIRVPAVSDEREVTVIYP